MPENKSRFVALCQQALAFGTVAALAVTATAVVPLEIVAPAPQGPGRPVLAAPAEMALVASEPVEPEVSEMPVRGVEKAGLEALTEREAARESQDEELAALSAPAEVDGFATVGVTWSPDDELAEEEVTVSVRSHDDGVWGDWEEIEYDEAHGPDPDSPEGRKARAGTDPIVVGAVDEVQVKVETVDGEAPGGMRLAVVDPRPTADPVLAEPAIDTADLPADLPAEGDVSLSSATTDPSPSSEEPVAEEPVAEEPAAEGEGVLAASVVTPKPKIFSRAQWGADERLRDKGSLKYFEVHAGFVHHTVNGNSYTREQVPSLLRGIYAYHTQSRGWSDIGYNFVVDKYGRIWEGRYGGVDRPVVGAHTLGYNEYSFAMSALGNFETAKPSSAMLQAYGRLMGWKLSLHGVSASSSRQWVGKRWLPAINGHRDAGQTACPGGHLYARLGRIRTLSAEYQRSFAGRDRKANLAGAPWPDLVVRHRTSKRLFMVRTGGQTNFVGRRTTSLRWGGMDLIAAPGDMNGDGIADLVARSGKSKLSGVYLGTASGGFGGRLKDLTRFGDADQIAGVRDFDGDGRNDVATRVAGANRLVLHRGNGRGDFIKRVRLSNSWGSYDLTVGAGDLTGDGRNDLLARNGRTLYLVPGRGTSLGARVALPGRWDHFSVIAGGHDLTRDGKPDILVRTRSGAKLAYVYPGDGKGGLGPRLGPFTQFAGMEYLAAAGQLAGNRTSDLVARNAQGRMLTYTHNGRRNVDSVTDTGVSAKSANLVLNVGDWNGDGHGDLMTRSARTGRMYLRSGDGRGRFAAPVLAGTGWSGVRLVTAVGDVTGDGNPDLMAQPSGGPMRIYPGNGGKGFRSSYVAYSGISAKVHAGVGLWNGDGAPDNLVKRKDGSLVVYRGNGPGGLTGATKVADGMGRYDWIRGVGDVTGDGRPDLLARVSRNGRLVVLASNAARTGFARPRLVITGMGAYDLSSS